MFLLISEMTFLYGNKYEVCLCLDTREISKSIINDRTSSEEMQKILKISWDKIH